MTVSALKGTLKRVEARHFTQVMFLGQRRFRDRCILHDMDDLIKETTLA